MKYKALLFITLGLLAALYSINSSIKDNNVASVILFSIISSYLTYVLLKTIRRKEPNENSDRN